MDQIASQVEVITPSRLHFGMFSFGRPGARQFGGVGMMIEPPGVRLRLTPESHLHVRGPLAERAVEFVHRWATRMGLARPPHVHIDVLDAPPQHAGYGAGTQLGLAVAAGLNAMHGRSWDSAAELAALVERGRRSSVGIYGFQHGGLIVEHGKLPHETIAPLQSRSDIPDEWRVVLIQPNFHSGLSGGEEQQAFAGLAPVPDDVTRVLWHEAEARMMPAIRAGDFAAFSESVYRFGQVAGMCFASVQGGPYNGAVLSEIVATARRLGVTGVGQSSWGPTIYCFMPDEPTAQDFVSRMQGELPTIDANYLVSRPANRGAQVIL
jgi:beta-RFAP synthase